MNISIMTSFVFFLVVLFSIGMYSQKESKKTKQDYLLAGRSVPPWLVGLSAMATWQSGFMFIGMMGYTYYGGLSVIWLLFGFLAGDFLVSLFVPRKIREATERQNSFTFAGLLSRWNGTDYRLLRFLGGTATVVLLGAYAAAQLNAGSKALHVLFGWNYHTGAIIGFIMVVGYCFAGGIRASIWTDAAQSVVMVSSMLIMSWVAIDNAGGLFSFFEALNHVSPDYMNLFPSDMRLGAFFGPILFISGWLVGGAGVVGQPHVMVRYMTIDRPESIGKARFYYYFWSTVSSVLTLFVGLSARIYLPAVATFDEELALPTLALELLPSVCVGLILAGVFAATMSTADSQILSCSASVTRDVLPFLDGDLRNSKFATLGVAVLALVIALSGSQSVFALVLISAGALAVVFAPLAIVYSLGGKPSEPLAIAMMLSGLGAMFLWQGLGYGDIAYEAMPGILASLALYYGTRFLKPRAA